MQGLLSSPLEFTADSEASGPLKSWNDYASAAVQCADALILELEKKA